MENKKMGELIQSENGKYESSLNNVTEKELLWVEKQVQRELSSLQQNVKEGLVKQSFFDRKTNKVEYHMDLVKEYLESCVKKESFQINGAVIMAVQIALESNGYDVGRIDGLLMQPSGKLSKTQKAIKDFQRDNKIRIDGFPGKKTISKILEKMGGVSKGNDTKNDEPKDKPEKIEGKKFTEKELLALEIYRGKAMTDEEIEKRGFDPKEIWILVHNKELMEYYDDIVIKTNRKQESINTPSKGILENDKKSDEKTENVETENIEIEDNNREISPNIKPIINKKSGEVENLGDILEARNLDLPRLKARDPKEVGGLGNSMMFGFQWYGKNYDKHFTQMMGAEGASTTTHILRSKFENQEKVEKYKEKNPSIKSFVLYFGGNTSNNEQTLNDLKNWAEWLSNAGIEPVLCTCIGVETHKTKKEEFKSVDGKRLEPLNDSIRKLVNESNGKYKLIDFAKVDDVIEMGSNKHPKSYALMHDIVYRCIEK